MLVSEVALSHHNSLAYSHHIFECMVQTHFALKCSLKTYLYIDPLMFFFLSLKQLSNNLLYEQRIKTCVFMLGFYKVGEES